MSSASTDIATVDHLSRDQLAEQLDSLSRLSVEELRHELAKSLRMTADSLVRLALIVRSLEDRGDDLSDLKIGLMPYLRQIAYGQVLPEIVVRYAERPILVRAISALPFPDQDRLASANKVAVAVRSPDGTLDHRLVDPLYMDRSQVNTVFATGRIRPIEEQIVLLENRAKPAAPVDAQAIGSIKIDRERRGLVVARRFVPAATLVEALAKLASPADDDDAGRDVSFAVPLTDAERDRLREAAAQGHTPMAVLVRRALRAYGLI